MAFDLHVTQVDATLKREPRMLVPAAAKVDPNESQNVDFGKFEQGFMLQGYYALPPSTGSRKALFDRINRMEAKFRAWCKRSVRLTCRRTAGGADITTDGLWASFSATLHATRPLEFDFNIDFRTGTVFTLAPPGAGAGAAPSALNASEAYTLTNGAAGSLTLNVERLGIKVVNEVQGFAPPSSKTVGAINPIMIPAGRVFTVYTVEGFTNAADHDAARLDLEAAVKNWWKDEPVNFQPGFLPTRQVTLMGVRFTRRVQEPAGLWHYILELRRGAQRSL